MIVVWDRGVATEGKPYEDACSCFVRMRDGEVDSSSCSDLWERDEAGDR